MKLYPEAFGKLGEVDCRRTGNIFAFILVILILLWKHAYSSFFRSLFILRLKLEGLFFFLLPDMEISIVIFWNVYLYLGMGSCCLARWSISAVGVNSASPVGNTSFPVSHRRCLAGQIPSMWISSLGNETGCQLGGRKRLCLAMPWLY